MPLLKEVIRTLTRVSSAAKWQQLLTANARIYITVAPNENDITRVFGPKGTLLNGGLYQTVIDQVGDTNLTDFVDLSKNDVYLVISHADIPDLQSNGAIFQSVWVGVIQQYLPATDEMITSVIRNTYGPASYNRKLPCIVK